ncbi:hypothetical protein [Saccharopolyspora mangrovi]|uniref:Uncharacterized protein n=1 Tax=Saccharopolyspora mangrovi TaxID=3082379 RepID=A0ABU6A8R3_9PSEU|nr:hypothetical protein [Saccharopolyspora sp. S2-29]MEB3367871.1 hypothetical protein [Saccharopolyspora sp. S2-29]
MVGEELVAAPRGRRMCFSAIAGGRMRSVFDVDARQIVEIFEGADARELEELGEAELLVLLADSVDRAMYWQEPDEIDRALASPEIPAVLLPTARALSAVPAARWWSSPVDLGAQFHVQIPQAAAPTGRPVAELLAEWRAGTVEDERRSRRRPSDVDAPVSGHWWSAPVGGLVTSTRARPAALGLCLQEDGFGSEWAWCRSVRPTGEPRVYEITGPEAWCELVERYPLEVTLSRRHDWRRVTGVAGRWVIPDWAGVAADHDAVHLTCTGYLTTAGRALPVGEAHTLLAGWDPDQTYWLTDDLDLGEPVLWRGEPDDLGGWRPAEPGERPPDPPAPLPRQPRWKRLLRALRTRPGRVVD